MRCIRHIRCVKRLHYSVCLMESMRVQHSPSLFILCTLGYTMGANCVNTHRISYGQCMVACFKINKNATTKSVRKTCLLLMGCNTSYVVTYIYHNHSCDIIVINTHSGLILHFLHATVQLEFNLTLACSELAYIYTIHASICNKLGFLACARVHYNALYLITLASARHTIMYVYITSTHCAFKNTLLKPSRNIGQPGTHQL